MADEITPNTQTPQIEPISEPVETTIPPEPEIPTIEPELTAQIPVSEPLGIPESPSEPIIETIPVETKPEIEIQSEPTLEPIPESVTEKVKAEIPESKTSESETIKTETEPEKEILETKTESKSEIKKDPSTENNNIQADKKPEPEKPKSISVVISTKNLARELLIKARNAIQSKKRKKLDKVMTLFAKQTKITNDEVEKFLHVSDATATRYLNILEKENRIKQSGKTGKYVFYSKI
jgi:predicted HTH transcriptional regulator